MLPDLRKIKGVHPGAILRRELKAQNLKGSELAVMLDEHKQTISAILNKRRDINPKLSIKLAKRFDVDEDYFMLLQASYDVKMAAVSETKDTPNLSKIRSVIFWDTSIDIIDWSKNKNAIIQRVLERGNTSEINEIISFYGKPTILKEIKTMKKQELFSLDDMIGFYLKRNPYGFSKPELLKQIINFSYAENDSIPICFQDKVWEIINLDFEELVRE